MARKREKPQTADELPHLFSHNSKGELVRIFKGQDPDAPEVAEQTRLADERMREEFSSKAAQMREIAHSIFRDIADIENPEPFPMWFSMQKANFIAWLIGENPGYRPTVMELKVARPAYIERLRRLKERVAIGNQQPAPEGGLLLTTNERLIVEALRDQHPNLLLIIELTEAVGDLSGRTVGDALRLLEKADVVHRPKGQRKGWGLTSKGLSLTSRRKP